MNHGWDISEFFSKNLISQLDPEGIAFPQIASRNMLGLGNNGGFTRTYYTHSLLNTLTWVKRNHSVKFGADLRLMTIFGQVFVPVLLIIGAAAEARPAHPRGAAGSRPHRVPRS